MATPKCPKCDSTSFEATIIEPHGSSFKVQAIHCKSCGCVVGTQDYYNTAKLLENLAEALKVKLKH